MPRFPLSLLRSLQLRRPCPVLRVRLAGNVVQLPHSCANCGEPAGQVLREKSARREVLVPYCARCFALASRAGTAVLATALASLVLGGTLLLTLPRVCATLELWSYLALSLVGTSLPPVIVGLFVRRKASDQTASGRAVWWFDADTLVGTHGAWFEELARLNQADVVRDRRRSPVFTFASWSGALLCVASAPQAYAFLFPSLLVLNLATAEFDLVVDGRSRGRVEPTSLESREAGLRLRIPAGKHTLEARPLDGSEPFEVRQVAFNAAGSYLFAPVSDEFCFWLETDQYGRKPESQSKSAATDVAAGGRYQALPVGRHFWQLPSRIDTWFGDNPAVGNDAVSSGGSMVALRQARCSQLPDGAKAP